MAKLEVVTSINAMVGAVLTMARKQKGLPQKEVAGALGLNVSTWSRIENGETSISVEQLFLAAKHLGFQPSTFLIQAEVNYEEMLKKDVTVLEQKDAQARVKLGVAIGLYGAGLTKLLGINPIEGWRQIVLTRAAIAEANKKKIPLTNLAIATFLVGENKKRSKDAL